MMTKADKIRIFEMKISGYTYEEIAVLFGTNRSNIEQILQASLKNNSCHDFKCIYPKVKKWMMDHAVSVNSLYVLLGNKPTGNGSVTMKKKLSGERRMRLDELQNLVTLTGIPFEDLFEQGVETNAESTMEGDRRSSEV